jgi:hypothetical protein
VVITQPTASFPNIPAHGTGAGATNFRISTTPCYSCGTPIVINAVFNYVGGSDVDSFTPPVTSSGYIVTSTTGASIVPGTADSGNHADDGTTTIALPFNYNFYGINYNTAALCSNGNIQFNTVNTAYVNACLPATGFTDAIYPHWDDLRTDIPAGTGIFTSTSGVAPNRIFNIEWRASYYSPSGVTINFEARLYEGQQRVDFIYGNLNGTGGSATVGIQHGNTFTQYECNAGGLSLGQQLTFQAGSCTSAGGQCAPSMSPPYLTGNTFGFTFQTVNCGTYTVQYKNNLDDASWQTAQTYPGDGTVKTYTTAASAAHQFYRLQVQ